MFRPVTLEDMKTENVNILVYCRCGHSAKISTDMLIEKMGGAVQVPRIAERMKCGKCGSKEVHTRPAYGCKISDDCVPGPPKVSL